MVMLRGTHRGFLIMSLPKPPEAVPVSRDLLLLAPGFKSKVDLLLNYMKDRGQDPKVFEAFRTDARQKYLYGLGRLYQGSIVTHAATAKDTWHGYGLAVDIIDRKKNWDAPMQFWTTLRDGCKFLKLTWGGDWNGNGIKDETFIDMPHVQLGNCPRSPKPSDYELVRTQGIKAIWKLYNVE
jgi:peptidoglycan L-alanyl-D-glutamate endopeptidase CwlK